MPNRAHMRAVLREELEALETWAATPGLPEDVADGIQISIDKIRRVLGEPPSLRETPAPQQT